MRVTLDQDEIEKAIITYVGNQGISITGKNVDVTLVAGRAPNGMSATIEISNDDHVAKALPSGLKGATVVEVTPQATFSAQAEETETEEDAEVVVEKDPNQKALFGN